MNYDQMRNKELREELKKRGLKGYSSLRKAQMIEYLSTGIHPLKSEQMLPFSTKRFNMSKVNNRVAFIRRNPRNQNAFS